MFWVFCFLFWVYGKLYVYFPLQVLNLYKSYKVSTEYRMPVIHLHVLLKLSSYITSVHLSKLRSLNYEVLITKLQNLFRFHQFFHRYPFTCSRTRSRTQHYTHCPVFSCLLSCVSFLVFIFHDNDLDECFIDCPSNWFCLTLSSHSTDVWVCRKNPTNVKCPSHHIISRR